MIIIYFCLMLYSLNLQGAERSALKRAGEDKLLKQLIYQEELAQTNAICKNIAISIARSVIEKRCDPNAIIAIHIPGIWEYSTFPIQALIQYDDLHELTEQIIACGANPDGYTGFPKEEDPKIIDNPSKVEEIINYTVDHKGYPEFIRPILFLSRNRPLRTAVSKLCLNQAEVLLMRGANPNLGSGYYDAPLHQLIDLAINVTCQHYHKPDECVEIAQLLLSGGASLSALSNRKQTPLEAILEARSGPLAVRNPALGLLEAVVRSRSEKIQ